MKRYSRKEIYSEIRDPHQQYVPLEGSFWDFVRYEMIFELTLPWYVYLVVVAIFVGMVFAGEWIIALLAYGFIVLLMIGKALFSAHMFHKMVKIGTYVGFDEKGVSVWIPTGEQDEDGNKVIEYAYGSPWYELNEIMIFDSFVVFNFVSMSELDNFFMPFLSEYDFKDWSDNTLAYWKQGAQDKPVGQKDRRLIWLIICIASFALKFLFKYLKALN